MLCEWMWKRKIKREEKIETQIVKEWKWNKNAIVIWEKKKEKKKRKRVEKRWKRKLYTLW